MEEESPILNAMSQPEKSRLHQTAKRAEQVYPGVVGEILAEFIDSWIEFGYKLGATAQMTRLHKHLWSVPVAGEDSKPKDEWTEIS